MRILFLTKQRYMGKDLLGDRFGRFFEIPRILAACGNEIQSACLKYRSTGGDLSSTAKRIDNVEWNSFDLGRNWPAGLIRHYFRLEDIAAAFRPNVIVGASDSIHALLAAILSRRMQVPLVLDLYDDFESYRATRFPGIKAGFKYAMRMASGISVVSDYLAAKVRMKYRTDAIVCTVTNAVCPEIFKPGNKIEARKRLGLPQTDLLIGTAGSLTRQRGIPILFRAFEALCGKIENLSLVLAGPKDQRANLACKGKVRYLGELPHHHVGDLFNALDVGIICNRNDTFGRHCFPQKMYEMLACMLPVVAARVGAAPTVLVGSERFLYDPAVVQTLVEALRAQLDARYVPPVKIPTWKDQGVLFNELLRTVVSSSRNETILHQGLDISE